MSYVTHEDIENYIKATGDFWVEEVKLEGAVVGYDGSAMLTPLVKVNLEIKFDKVMAFKEKQAK